MKKFTLSALAAFTMAVSFGQTIYNPGFETWVNNNETNTTFLEPQHWVGSDVFATYVNEQFGNQTYTVNTISRVPGHNGSYAVQMAVAVSNMGDTVPGAVYSMDSASTLFINSFTGGGLGYPFTSRPANITGFYKLVRAGGDTATVIVIMTKWNSVTGMRDTVVDQETNYMTTAATAWTSFSVPLTYLLPVYPDTVFIAAGITNHVMPEHIGTLFTIDDLAFTGTVLIGIDEQKNNPSVINVYPNPFDNEATVSISNFQLTNGSIEIYDVLGNKVRVIEGLSGNSFRINREGLSSGLYFYNVINDNAVVGSGKMSVN